MSQSKPNAPMGVFEALSTALSRSARGEYEAILEALRDDLPQLGALIAEQAGSANPAASYKKYLELRQDLSYGRQRGEVGNPALVQSLFTWLPRASDKRNWTQKRTHERDTYTCEALVLDDSVLGEALAGGQGKEIASFLLADLFSTIYRRKLDIVDPGVRARLDALLDHAEPDRIVHHLVRSPFLFSGKERIGEGGDPKNSTEQRLCELWDTTLGPAVEAHKTFKASAGTPIDDPALPVTSLARSVIEAQDTLRKQIKKQRVDVGDWLNRDKLWMAVRNTGLQEAFVRACLQAGALKKMPAPSATVHITTANLLLEGAIDEDLPKAATPQGAYAAREALIGYIDCVGSKSELLRLYDAFHQQSKASDEPLALGQDILGALTRKSDQFPLSVEDASEVRVQPGDRLPQVHTQDSLDLLATMNPSRWTVEELDAAWQRGPRAHNCRGLLLATMAALGPDGFDRLSDESARRVALGWPHAGGTWGKLKNPTMHDAVERILDRAMRLPNEALPQVAGSYLRIFEHNDDENGRKLERVINQALGERPSAQQIALLEYFAQQPLHRVIVPRVKAIPNPGEVLARILPTRPNGRYETGLKSSDVNLVARLLGYQSENDKNAALKGLSENDAMRLLGLVAQTVHARRGQEGISQALLKNMVFDLMEHVPAVEPVVLSKDDLVVQAGFAQPGERLTFEGATVFFAPYLDQPRPSLDAIEANKPTQETPMAAQTAPLGKEDMRQRLAAPLPRHEGAKGAYGHMFPKGMGPGWGMMGRGDMFESMVDRMPFNHMPLDHLPPQMLKHTPVPIRQILVGREIMLRVINGEWFAPSSAPVAEPGKRNNAGGA